MPDPAAAQETRILRLESDVQDMATGLATATTKLEAFGDKLDGSIEVLGTKLDRNACAVEKMAAHLEKSNGRVEKLESWRSDAEIRAARNRKILSGLALAVAGGLAKAVFDLIARHL